MAIHFPVRCLLLLTTIVAVVTPASVGDWREIELSQAPRVYHSIKQIGLRLLLNSARQP